MFRVSAPNVPSPCSKGLAFALKNSRVCRKSFACLPQIFRLCAKTEHAPVRGLLVRLQLPPVFAQTAGVRHTPHPLQSERRKR
eukprot:3344399-Rhodomonas_salina.2